jgi:agmatinase
MKNKSSAKSYNPDAPGQDNGSLFGIPPGAGKPSVTVIPVPWEVTVSYNSGTAAAPEAVLKASPQLDLYDKSLDDVWMYAPAMLTADEELEDLNEKLRPLAADYIDWLETGSPENDKAGMEENLKAINNGCQKMVERVSSQASRLIKENQKPAVLGGDHSCALGLIQALAKKHDEFGILQIDAHMDLRDAYEDFTYSHASVMYNALKLGQVKKLVQIGIRDYCKEEADYASENKYRIKSWIDRKCKKRIYQGDCWCDICNEMIAPLPQKVYVSFDIDGLDPKLSPGTGTPVPGGLEFEESLYLIDKIVESGREIIGFDLCEIGPRQNDEWDANVGARLLYRLGIATLKSELKQKNHNSDR